MEITRGIEEYKLIVNQLIKESFPELRSFKFLFLEVPRFFPFWSFVQKGYRRFFFILNKVYQKLDDEAVKGNLAHELCHLVLDHQYRGGINDLFHNFVKFLSFAFNTKMSREIENKVDREVIRRGYARDLLSSHLAWEKFFSERALRKLHSRGYLTSEQIKTYAKKIGKWQQF